MTHLVSTFPDRVQLGAIRYDDWSVEIIRSGGGTERREGRWQESCRSYEVSLPPMKRDDAAYIAVRALYAEALGCLHSFDFTDWTDDEVVPVRFDSPMRIVGLTPDIDHIQNFTLVEVKNPAVETTTRCQMLLLELRNGEFIGITDHDEAIDYELVTAGSGEVTYSAGSGILPSDVSLPIGFDAGNYEVQGPLGGLVTRVAVLGGKFDRARAWLFEVDWSDTSDMEPIMVGNVAEPRVEGGRFIFQVRSDVDRLNQTIGRLISPYCDATFGDARCGVTPESIVGTVTGITDAGDFTVSFSGSYADDYFNMGEVEALTGDLAGTLPMEIERWYSTGRIVLFAPLADVPGFTDTFTIRRGCSKLLVSDDASIPTCLSYDNADRFRGFPFMPGTDQIKRYPIPGEGGT